VFSSRVAKKGNFNVQVYFSSIRVLTAPYGDVFSFLVGRWMAMLVSGTDFFSFFFSASLRSPRPFKAAISHNLAKLVLTVRDEKKV